MSARAIAACSFCRKSDAEVQTLVAGPGVFICNQCVAFCLLVIEKRPDSLPDLAPWEQAHDLDEALANLPRIASAGAQAEANLHRWVQRARTLGASWARVGDALGVTRQSAWERFAGPQ